MMTTTACHDSIKVIDEQHLDIVDNVLNGFKGRYDSSWGNKLIIPNGVTSIKNSAFFGTLGLKYLDFTSNKTLIYISQFSFKSCHDLKEIKLSENILSINEYAFE
jgi:hypothetical protein